MKFKEFLEKASIGVKVEVVDVIKNRPKVKNEQQWDRLLRGDKAFNFPSEIKLYCDSEDCKLLAYFALKIEKNTHLNISQETAILLEYECRNCQTTNAKIALIINLPMIDNKVNLSGQGEIIKFGQDPINREPTTNRVLKMIGSERKYFFQGLKSEGLGLGIAAFAYYRRVIEHQKNRIFDEMLKAATRLEASKELISQINEAKEESQFSKSIDMIKSNLPAKILIKNHNPLKLLYSALSEGLHNEDDNECLRLAKSIRLILSEFANNLDQINNENDELDKAINELTNNKKNPQ